MKYGLAFLTTLLLLVGCSNSQQKDIEHAAQGYLDAVCNYLIDEAAPYATRQTRENTIPTLNHFMTLTDTAFIKSNRPATITLTGTRMLSDTSARVYYHRSTPIKEDDDSVLVILEEGQWLVDVQMRPLPFMNEKRPNRITLNPETREAIKKRIDKQLADSKK